MARNAMSMYFDGEPSAADVEVSHIFIIFSSLTNDLRTSHRSYCITSHSLQMHISDSENFAFYVFMISLIVFC